jgi:hypothetical protein
MLKVGYQEEEGRLRLEHANTCFGLCEQIMPDDCCWEENRERKKNERNK